ncbi:DUF3344 domain-containing protein, partial [Methanophagales archaeon]
KRRYITLLNHTELSLAPGAKADVTGTWENISVYGNPTYIVKAIADPLDEIDEINEGNNEMSLEIIMNASDLTVAGFNSPTERNNASVVIENLGAQGASDVTVRFELSRYEPYTLHESGFGNRTLSHPGAANIRVHFQQIEMLGDDGFVEVSTNPIIGDSVIETYSGQYKGWTSWVKSDTVYICYFNASFWIDGYDWGDVQDITIPQVNGSESINVSLPWQEYRRPERLNVTVDPYNNITEQREDNNNGTALIYIDLVLKGVEIDGNWIKATVWSDDTIEDGIAFPPPCDFEVSCLPGFTPKIINKSFYGGDTEEVWFNLTEGNFQANRKYNLLVEVDSEDVIEEMDETNNNESLWIGPDVTIVGIKFLNENENEVASDKFIVNKPHFIEVEVKNMKGKVGEDKYACIAAEYFDVVVNMTNETLSPESITISDSLSPGENKTVKFSWTPSTRGWFDVIIKAEVDTKGDVREVNENNNSYLYSGKIKVGEPGYMAKGGFMPMFKKGEEEFNGGIIYETGDTSRLGSDEDRSTLKTNFGDPVPEDARVKLVRLYVYPDYAHWPNKNPLVEPWMAFLPDETQLNVTFNGYHVPLKKPTSFIPVPNDHDQPADIPDATKYNASYATYCYDVPITYYNHSEGANNWAEAERINYARNPDTDYRYGIAGMALLIIYEDDDAPLIRYWIGEDRDVMEAKNGLHKTGLEYADCRREVKFTGVKYSHLANATLKTVLVSYVTYGEGDALYFNDVDILPSGTGHWSKVGGDIALTQGHDNARGWEYVDVHDGINTAGIESRGTMMCAAHAILKLTYYPDLEPEVPTRLNANAGASYNIPITIHNWGRSKAKNFNVTVSINGNEVLNETISEEIKGGDTVTINIPQKAPAVEGVVTLEVNVTVDPENRVNELINKYPRGKQHKSNGEENNIWNGTVTVVVRPPGWDIRHGGGGGTGGGWGTGVGTGEGSGSGAGKGVAGGSREGGAGESGGKTITGRLMKGVVVPGGKEAGGGGKGEFSPLRFFIQLVMLAVAIVLVYAGYLMERRRQTHKQ